jgi:hypothetical protein
MSTDNTTVEKVAEITITSMTITERLIRIMQNIDAITKDRSVSAPGANYKFRGIDDVINTCHPLFAEYGVFVLPEVLEFSETERVTKSGSAIFYTKLKVKYTFVSEKGDQISAVGIGEGMDSGDKSTNKAMSAALKYILTQMLLIPTEDPKDSENDTFDVVSVERGESLEKLIVFLNQLKELDPNARTSLENKLKTAYKRKEISEFTLPQLNQALEYTTKTIETVSKIMNEKEAKPVPESEDEE